MPPHVNINTVSALFRHSKSIRGMGDTFDDDDDDDSSDASDSSDDGSTDSGDDSDSLTDDVASFFGDGSGTIDPSGGTGIAPLDSGSDSQDDEGNYSDGSNLVGPSEDETIVGPSDSPSLPASHSTYGPTPGGGGGGTTPNRAPTPGGGGTNPAPSPGGSSMMPLYLGVGALALVGGVIVVKKKKAKKNPRRRRR